MAKTNQILDKKPDDTLGTTSPVQRNIDLGDQTKFSYLDPNFPETHLSHYKFSDGTHPCGVKPLPDSRWMMNPDNLINTGGEWYHSIGLEEQGQVQNICLRGNCPTFERTVFYKDTPGTVYMHVSDTRLWFTSDKDGNNLVCSDGSSDPADYSKSNFKDGVIPRFMIAILQGAGGGGSGGNAFPSKGASGGGGGSGGCIALIFRVLRDDNVSYGKYCFKLVVGKGGAGKSSGQGSGGDGEETSLIRYYCDANSESYANDLWAEAPGGWGASSATGGSAGDAGYMDSIPGFKNFVGYPLHSFDGEITSSTSYTDAELEGKAGGTHANGSNCPKWTVALTQDSTYKLKSGNYKTLGGFSGGDNGYEDWPGGGAASFFADGGAGGGAGSSGKNGSRGSGGGGAPGTAFGAPGGGNGGNGLIWLFY